LRIAVQAHAAFGQGHAAGLAVEEGDPQARLQLAHFAGHRRLADVQALGAGADAAALGDGEEHLEVMDIHK